MRVGAGTRTPSKSTRYCVSDAIVICCVSVTPARVGSTRNRSTSSAPSPVRASTTQRVGRRGERHVPLRAVEHEPVAVGVGAQLHALAGRSRRSGSSHAGVRIASPAAIRGSHSARCSSVPGPQRARRRSSPSSRSAATARAPGRAPRRRPRASSIVMPEPPYSSGIISPSRPSSASCFQSSVGIADRVVLELRARRSSDACCAHTPRTVSRSISCSSVKSRSIVVLLACSRAPVRRRAGSTGCRRRRSGRRRAPCTSVATVVADGERRRRGRPSRSRRRRSSTVVDRAARAPSCRRGTPSPSCGTSSGRAGPSARSSR